MNRPRIFVKALHLLAVSFLASAAIAQSPVDLVAQAIDATGGEAKLAAISTVVTRSRHRHWDPQQTAVANQGTNQGGASNFTLSLDLQTGKARQDWVRHNRQPGNRLFMYSEVLADGYGFVLGADNIVLSKQARETTPPLHTMSRSRVVAAMREIHRVNPRLLLEMKNNPDKLSALPDEVGNGKKLKGIGYAAQDAQWRVFFDPDTKLIDRVRTVDGDGIWGDSNFDMVLSDWRDIAGVKFPYKRMYYLAGRETQEALVEEVVVNSRLPADLFAIPSAVKETHAKQQTPSQINLQWFIRRSHWGSFIDSDTLAFDPTMLAANKWTEVKPGIWHVTGGSHNTLVVEMKDHLVVFDAPVGNEMSRLTVAEAERRFPGKPFKHLVMSHHHMDHANGARVFAAKGASVVFSAGNREYFEGQMTAPNSIRNDELWTNPRKVPLIEVKDKLELSDGVRKIMLYPIANTHAPGLLIAHIPDADFGWVVDLWSPSRDTPNDRASHGEFLREIRRLNVMPTLWAGGHGAGPAPLQPWAEAVDDALAKLAKTASK